MKTKKGTTHTMYLYREKVNFMDRMLRASRMQNEKLN
jgi:hypothetical protein